MFDTRRRYSLRHNFNGYNERICNYMSRLNDYSKALFDLQQRRGAALQSDYKSLEKCIRNVEDYLYYNYIRTESKDFDNIFNSISNKVSQIAVLPPWQRGIYGKTDVETMTIWINPNMSYKGSLTGEQRMKLYMAHELGHAVNDCWIKKAEEYANKLIQSYHWKKDDAQLIYDGFCMLDEAITQNRAENFIYGSLIIGRPDLIPVSMTGRHPMFGGESYRTNFDYYGELQEPASMFARTLRGIGKERNLEKALNLLSQRALSPTFFDNILNEYERDGQMDAFFQQLTCMGYLRRAAYANFGYYDSDTNARYLDWSKGYLDMLKSMNPALVDPREPLDDTWNR